MPNYHYRCQACSTVYEMTLPISHDPKLVFSCSADACDGDCKRVILSTPQFKGFKVFAGDWFKKTYGFELGGDGITRKQFQEDVKKAERLAKQDGTNVNFEHIKKLEDRK